MRIAIITAYTPWVEEWRQAGEISVDNKRKYCDKHGYDLKVFTSGFEESRHYSWSKVLFLKKTLPYYDWVFWTDADVLIMNQDIKLETFIDSKYDFVSSLTVGNDPAKAEYTLGNCLIKNSPFIFEVLDEVWTYKEYAGAGAWDETAFNIVVNKWGIQNRLKYYPQRVMNAFPCNHPDLRFEDTPESRYQEGDFLVHFARWKVNRVEVLKEWAGRVIN